MNIKNKIINLLKENARLSFKDLGAMIGISEAEAGNLVRELERDGIIRGYSVIVNEEALSSDNVEAFIEVKVTPEADCGFDEIARTIMMYDEVKDLTLMSGAFDLAVTISGTNYKEIALFVARKLSTIEGVISTATHFTLKPYKEKGFFIEDAPADERGFISP
ncbi:MAG: Lrp/AsnC family transcriptional regulator [Ruminococcus sp.]|jgi:DNA-binding Lrp family transcriptional regulator|nr:Lrp/AsnC family transcriptional regulator [Ruminococcus sp.]